jgi:hypothetical protein
MIMAPIVGLTPNRREVVFFRLTAAYGWRTCSALIGAVFDGQLQTSNSFAPTARGRRVARNLPLSQIFPQSPNPSQNSHLQSASLPISHFCNKHITSFVPPNITATRVYYII